MKYLSTILLLFSSLAFAQTTSFRYEGVLQGGSVSTGTSTQNFTVTLDRPDCPANSLGLTPWTGNVTVVDGAFTLNPSFSSSTLQNALNPATSFGAPCSAGVYSPRRLKITWNTAPSETFYVPLDDSPRASFSSVAANSNAIGGVSVQPNMTCASGSFLKYNSGLTRFECQPLAASDVPTLSASVISSGTFSSAQLPAPAGDISGTYAAMSVERIRGTNVSATAPTTNQVLKYNGSAWAPAADDTGAAVGDASYVAKGVVQINTSAAFSGLQITSGVLSLADITTGTSLGASNMIPTFTYDNKGRITAGAAVTVNDSTKLPLAGGTMSGNLNMGAQQITNVTSISTGSASLRDLILNDADSSNNVTIRTPTSLSPNYTLTLPADDGSNGQVLSTDGTGTLSWITPAAGGGGDVLNNGNTFGGVMTLGTNDANDLFLETNNTPRIHVRQSGEVGIGTNPTTGMGLDLAGPFNMRHTISPSVSATGQGRIYYDSTTNRFRVSQNGSAYVDMINPGAITGNGTAGYLSKWSSASTIVDSAIFDNGTNIGINTNTPLERLDLDGAINQRGMAGPPAGGLSQVGNGKIYFNSTTGKFRVSEDNGPWRDLVNTDVVSNTDYYFDIDPAANCSTVQTPYWSIALDRWQCQDINSTTAGGFIRESGNSFGFDMTIGTNTNQAVNIETNGATRMTITADGRVGIGTTPVAPFHSQATLTTPTGDTHNGYFSSFVTPSATHSGTYNSLISEMNIMGPNNVAQAYAANIRSFTTSNSTVTSNSGLNVLNQKSGTGTTNSSKAISSSLEASAGHIPNAVGIISDVRTTTSGTMDTVRGISSVISNDTGTTMTDVTAFHASITNNGFGANSLTGIDINMPAGQQPSVAYGVKIGNLNGTTKYGVYQADATARNYYAGNVGIGTQTPVASLDVVGTVKIGSVGTPVTRVIVCNGVSFTNGANIPTGMSAIVASNAGTCVGVLTGMTFSCSLDSENLSVATYMPYTANSTDQTNNQIRMRVFNHSGSTITTATLTATFTCVGTRN